MSITETLILDNDAPIGSFQTRSATDAISQNQSTAMAYPGVAVAVIVGKAGAEIHGSFVLVGRRTGELGTDQWSLPGGKVDFGETPIEAAIREVKEETGIELDRSTIQFTGHVTNDFFPDMGKQYITLYYWASVLPFTKAIALEPEKTAEWSWVDVATLPSPMWEHTGEIIESFFRLRKIISIPGVDNCL